ncbi:MAG TPA: DegT/DnrJ/EryC1/StrS family aminotransferase [Chitinophagaceae bacterium]
MIPYEDLKLVNKEFSNDFLREFEKVLSSGWYILGDEVRKFEADFAAYHDIPHCIGVANGLDALILSLKTLNLPPGSEVIVPSNTYIATILSIIHCGLKPVLVEPRIDTYNIDPEKIAGFITSNTSAILVVHLYGKCCDMDPVLEICRHHRISLIEDCAQSHGARYKNRLCGTFGEAAAFSFYPTKNLGCLGDGGAVLTSDGSLETKIRLLRNYGSSRKYYNEEVGYNSRLDELQAAFLQVKLKKLHQINSHKKKLAELYRSHLSEAFIKPHFHSDYDDVFHIFTVRHERRDALREYLRVNGVNTEVHYPVPPHQQKALLPLLGQMEFPISEEIHKTILSLPCSTAHTEEDIYRVIEVMNKFPAR